MTSVAGIAASANITTNEYAKTESHSPRRCGDPWLMAKDGKRWFDRLSAPALDVEVTRLIKVRPWPDL